MGNIVTRITEILRELSDLDPSEKIEVINQIREELHEYSPFKNEPVDFVKWVRGADVTANDYNPNSVAPSEMELLATSVLADGYTQPIVANKEAIGYVIIDGFHRSRVGKENSEVKMRVNGYLPVVQIRRTQISRRDRIASTVRHNRARGKHGVEAMSGLVAELAKKGWNNKKIGTELGMDDDEVLRLKQITGLSELFQDEDFSEAWEIAK